MHSRYNVCDYDGAGKFIKITNLKEVPAPFYTVTLPGLDKLIPTPATDELTHTLYFDYRNTKSCLCTNNPDGSGAVIGFIEGDHI
jgi:hypothetical protein